MSTQFVPTNKGVVSTRQIEPPLEPPPIPPRGGMLTRIQGMPPGGRWALGLGLATLSAFVLWALTGAFLFSHSVAFVLTVALALAAGVALPSWRAGIALAGAMLLGGALASIAAAIFVTDVEGQRGVNAFLIELAFFALVDLAPLILLAFAGIGLGRLAGLTLGQTHALTPRATNISRWIAAIFPIVAAGVLATQIGNLPGMLGMQPTTGGAFELMPGIAYAVALSLTCLLAAWLLRSWLGFLVTVVAYVAATALILVLLNGGGTLMFVSLGFVLYILVPAVVMSAVGTLIGMLRARGARQPA